MLDIGFIRDNPDLIKEAVRKKRADIDVDNLLGLDEKRRGLIKETDTFRAQQNTASEKISHMAGEEREEAIVAMRELKERISHKEEELRIIEEEYTQLLLLVPNIPDLSVPDGNSDADNQEVRTYGEKPHFTFEPKDHITLLQELDLADFERGAKVSGFRGYFLKGDAAMLSLALWQFAFEALEKKGFTVHMAPALVRGATLVGTGWLPQGKDEVYKVGNDLYLSGTAEVSMMGMFEDEIFEAKDLPMTVAGFSSCFRSEPGSYGKDTKGLYRVHEFMKVEQVVLCQADHEESVKWHEELTKNAEGMLQELGLPYRVVVNCGADLGLGQVKKYDIEAWIPSQQKYDKANPTLEAFLPRFS